MTQITREELYALVWTEPTCKLAQRFGISDVGLAKTCRRHRIPRPSRGHWAKVRHGMRVRQRPLPPLAEDETRLSTVTFSGDPAILLDDVVERQKDYELDPEHRIVVPDELVRPHRLFRRRMGQKQSLRGVLHKRLCQKCYKRGLRIADTLLKALDERGFETELADEVARDSVFIVQVHGQPLAVNISEQMDRIEKKRRRLFSHYDRMDVLGPAYETYHVSVCSRRLKLSIMDHHVVRVRQNWADTEKRSLESQLNSFIVGLVVASRVKTQRIAEREERERQWAEVRARRAEERRQQEEELRRIHQLEVWSEEWTKACRIRAFLSTIRQSLDARSEGDVPETLGAWLQWAEHYVTRIDPVRQILERGPGAIPPPLARSAHGTISRHETIGS